MAFQTSKVSKTLEVSFEDLTAFRAVHFGENPVSVRLIILKIEPLLSGGDSIQSVCRRQVSDDAEVGLSNHCVMM